MKLKDIEKSLKNEQKQMGIPDVLARSKKAPINRLLDGQTPLRAFNKPMASRLLWCAMILLVAIILCVAVYMLMPQNVASPTLGYLSVTIKSGESEDRYGLVVDEDLSVLVVVHEEGDVQSLPGVVHTSNNTLEIALKELYSAKSADKACVCAYYSSNKLAQNALDVARGIFDNLFATADVNEVFEARIANEDDKTILLEMLGSDVTKDMGANEIVEAYLDKFLQA